MSSIRIYTTPWCPFCHRAKDLLVELGYAFEEIDVDQNPELRSRLAAENHGYRTVPMIFFGERFIGGYSELRSLHERGELQTLRLAE